MGVALDSHQDTLIGSQVVQQRHQVQEEREKRARNTMEDQRMMQFNGEERNEWPVFAKGLIAMGARKGGWDEALEYELDLKVAANKRLNKMAWCYLTLMLEGDALHEMDMVQDNNAYEVWQHLNKEYAPRVGKRMKFTTQAIEFDGAWEEERVYQDHPIKEEEKSVEDSDKLQVDPKVDDDEDYEDHPIKEEESGTQDVNKKEKCLSGEEGNEYFKCHDNQDEQHGMEKMIVETSDEMVVPNEIMEQGKQQITMTESVSENPKFQSEEKEIEQQEGRYGKEDQEENTNGIDLWKKNTEADEREMDAKDPGENGDEVKIKSIREEEQVENIEVESKWESKEAEEQVHEPLVEGREEKPTREHVQEGQVEPREFNTESSGDNKHHVQEDHEESSVEPREHEDMSVRNVFETIKVDMEEKGGEKDAKDGKECQIGEETTRNHDVKGEEKCLNGDPEVWMQDANIFDVFLNHQKERHSIEKGKVSKIHGEREDQQMSGELGKKLVPKIVRAAVSKFKEKAEQ